HANLCLRCTYLFQAGLLSAQQVNRFTSSLFAHTDALGLPADTGCLDALILSFPRRQGLNEVDAFRAKHLQRENQPPSWRDLRRTVTVARQFPRSRSRSLGWTRRDLTTILDLAELQLANAGVPAEDIPHANDPIVAVLHRNKDLQRQSTFLDCLATL